MNPNQGRERDGNVHGKDGNGTEPKRPRVETDAGSPSSKHLFQQFRCLTHNVKNASDKNNQPVDYIHYLKDEFKPEIIFIQEGENRTDRFINPYNEAWESTGGDPLYPLNNTNTVPLLMEGLKHTNPDTFVLWNVHRWEKLDNRKYKVPEVFHDTLDLYRANRFNYVLLERREPIQPSVNCRLFALSYHGINSGDFEVRQSQLRKLLEWVRCVVEKLKVPALIGGDFNLPPEFVEACLHLIRGKEFYLYPNVREILPDLDGFILIRPTLHDQKANCLLAYPREAPQRLEPWVRGNNKHQPIALCLEAAIGPIVTEMQAFEKRADDAKNHNKKLRKENMKHKKEIEKMKQEIQNPFLAAQSGATLTESMFRKFAPDPSNQAGPSGMVRDNPAAGNINGALRSATAAPFQGQYQDASTDDHAIDQAANRDDDPVNGHYTTMPGQSGDEDAGNGGDGGPDQVLPVEKWNNVMEEVRTFTEQDHVIEKEKGKIYKSCYKQPSNGEKKKEVDVLKYDWVGVSFQSGNVTGKTSGGYESGCLWPIYKQPRQNQNQNPGETGKKERKESPFFHLYIGPGGIADAKGKWLGPEYAEDPTGQKYKNRIQSGNGKLLLFNLRANEKQEKMKLSVYKQVESETNDKKRGSVIVEHSHEEKTGDRKNKEKENLLRMGLKLICEFELNKEKKIPRWPGGLTGPNAFPNKFCRPDELNHLNEAGNCPPDCPTCSAGASTNHAARTNPGHHVNGTGGNWDNTDNNNDNNEIDSDTEDEDYGVS